ncbi:MAG: hypothetical protein EFT35_06960 [Methanophagales archaeon ANME-1-THS]|nr:MAG: hypothetical protein EFT35_06960 [Methanophagales archaeon ANME-1-THS]
MREGTDDPEGEGAIIELSKRIDDLRNDSNSRFNDAYLRLNHVETEIGKLRGDMNERFTRIESEMKTNFRWMVGMFLMTMGIIISMWVTIIMAIFSSMSR